ncbi:hypothetical protein QTP70_024289 [Hemibagrus guttatus]|uniref:Uncharacterized protein n=1 Tax=Hemibagrus guttatus TaxID=175788 RepID=A0AAE0RHY7_9TELE|nr:hypothetical protein QTP70_024289 [Hemibagrus guttatus]
MNCIMFIVYGYTVYIDTVWFVVCSASCVAQCVVHMNRAVCSAQVRSGDEYLTSCTLILFFTLFLFSSGVKKASRASAVTSSCPKQIPFCRIQLSRLYERFFRGIIIYTVGNVLGKMSEH